MTNKYEDKKLDVLYILDYYEIFYNNHYFGFDYIMVRHDYDGKFNHIISNDLHALDRFDSLSEDLEFWLSRLHRGLWG